MYCSALDCADFDQIAQFKGDYGRRDSIEKFEAYITCREKHSVMKLTTMRPASANLSVFPIIFFEKSAWHERSRIPKLNMQPYELKQYNYREHDQMASDSGCGCAMLRHYSGGSEKDATGVHFKGSRY